MTWDNVQQLIRIICYMAGPTLIQRGLLTDEMLETAIGGIIAIGSVVWWSAWNRKRPDNG